MRRFGIGRLEAWIGWSVEWVGPGVLVVGALLVGAGPAAGQGAGGAEDGSGPPQLDRLEAGDRIEVWSPLLVDRRQRGALQVDVEHSGSGSDTLVVAPTPLGPTTDTVYRVPLASVERLRVATGSHPGTFRGALLGASVGLIAAIVYDKATGERGEDGLHEIRWGLRAGIFGGSTVAGALVGRAFTVDEWREVRLR